MVDVIIDVIVNQSPSLLKINMDGSNRYVNYYQPRTTLNEMLKWCYYTDETCVSFDIQNGVAYAHRVGKGCAAAAGAVFRSGTSGGVTFYQIKDKYREGLRKVNVSGCNVDLNEVDTDSALTTSDTPLSANTFLFILAGIFWHSSSIGYSFLDNVDPYSFSRVVIAVVASLFISCIVFAILLYGWSWRRDRNAIGQLIVCSFILPNVIFN